ncbi:MAG TPA: hypothetical protein VLL05_14765, partial [Terriglobales bacterium]|nr:hypothetical protein [Terriglobales bacterium]
QELAEVHAAATVADCSVRLHVAAARVVLEVLGHLLMRVQPDLVTARGACGHFDLIEQKRADTRAAASRLFL